MRITLPYVFSTLAGALRPFRYTLIVVVLAAGLTWLWLRFQTDHGVVAALLADPDAVYRAPFWRAQPWRLATGPLVHATTDHMIWDLGLLLALGVAYERRVQRAVWLLLLALGLVVPTAVVLAVHPELDLYFGTSGLSYALMAAIVSSELLRGNRHVLLVVAALALVAKVTRDMITTTDIFVTTDLGSGAEKIPEAHLAGALIGVAIIICCRRWRR